MILEPKLDSFSTLPILTPDSQIKNGLATPTREKRVSVKHGVEWVLGGGVGLLQPQGVFEVLVDGCLGSSQMPLLMTGATS